LSFLNQKLCSHEIFDSMSEFSTKSTLRYALGPGLIMAAAAVGVSHLVQSTRAGADFGFTLVWAVVLANIFKYPFLEFGPRYAIAAKESLIDGFKRQGKLPLWIFIIFTVGTMFIVQAAVTIVTASLAAELFGIVLTPWLWSLIILGVCAAILFQGQYSALDMAIKIIMVTLSVSTIIAIVIALTGGAQPAIGEAPSVWTVTGVSFLIALMGWMPIPIDGAAWHSLWTHERIKQTKHTPNMRECLIDFNIGYIGAAILALAFLSLGALVMFGKGMDFAGSGGAFSRQLVTMYTDTLGGWSYLIIIICAFTTMFSTTITVTDAYPRVCQRLLELHTSRFGKENTNTYRWLLVLVSLCSLGVLYFWGEQFTFLVDLATTLSFLVAPVLGYINFRLVSSNQVPEEYRPKGWLKWLSWSGLVFLTGFALLFLYWKVMFG